MRCHFVQSTGWLFHRTPLSAALWGALVTGRSQAMHLRQEHPRSCAQRALCSCPSRCPAPQTWPRLGGCPKPQSTSGLKTRVPVCGASLGFHRCQMSQEVCAGPPGLLSCSGRGMAGWTRGPSRAGGRTRFGPPCLGASAWLLCLPSPRPSSQSCSHSSWPDEHCPEWGAEAR